VLGYLMADQDRRQDNDRLLAALTPREREVLACLAEGAGRREVAEQLHLSANTVRTHLQNLMAKLGVHSTLEAVALSRPHLEQLRPSS
jgi:DNA-binding CsgD family transcriptional regulator